MAIFSAFAGVQIIWETERRQLPFSEVRLFVSHTHGEGVCVWSMIVCRRRPFKESIGKRGFVVCCWVGKESMLPVLLLLFFIFPNEENVVGS